MYCECTVQRQTDRLFTYEAIIAGLYCRSLNTMVFLCYCFVEQKSMYNHLHTAFGHLPFEFLRTSSVAHRADTMLIEICVHNAQIFEMTLLSSLFASILITSSGKWPPHANKYDHTIPCHYTKHCYTIITQSTITFESVQYMCLFFTITFFPIIVVAYITTHIEQAYMCKCH